MTTPLLYSQRFNRAELSHELIDGCSRTLRNGPLCEFVIISRLRGGGLTTASKTYQPTSASRGRVAHLFAQAAIKPSHPICHAVASGDVDAALRAFERRQNALDAAGYASDLDFPG